MHVPRSGSRPSPSRTVGGSCGGTAGSRRLTNSGFYSVVHAERFHQRNPHGRAAGHLMRRFAVWLLRLRSHKQRVARMLASALRASASRGLSAAPLARKRALWL